MKFLKKRRWIIARACTTAPRIFAMIARFMPDATELSTTLLPIFAKAMWLALLGVMARSITRWRRDAKAMSLKLRAGLTGGTTLRTRGARAALWKPSAEAIGIILRIRICVAKAALLKLDAGAIGTMLLAII
jgi:hypothetical protein